MMNLNINWRLLSFVCVLGAACSAADSGSSGPGTEAARGDCALVESGFGEDGEVRVTAEEVVSGLEVPWAVGFLPDGDLLVSERPGRVRLVRDGVLVNEAVLTVPVSEQGEGGLLGLVLHPEFSSNRFFYIYYTTSQGGVDVNRVERYRLSDDSTSATLDRTIIDNIPAGVFHNGGRLRFGPDDRLYVGTGDARDPELSQDPGSPAGKILRLNADGSIPDDNPIEGSPVYLLGVRNTQGFDWISDTVMIISDHGPSGELGRSGHDEVSFASAGENLGWPPVWRCEQREGFVTPAIVWKRALPPGGAALYRGSGIPEWQGSLLLGSLGSTHLQRVVVDSEGTLDVTGNEVYFRNELGRIREVTTGPDGELYITTSNCDGRGSCGPKMDAIYRIRSE